MEYLSLGKVIDSFSLDGTLKIFSTTNNAHIRYKKGNKVLLVSSNEKIEVTVSSYRGNGTFDFLKVEEITNPEQAILYKGYEVQVEKNQKDLPKDNYFYSDLKGCSVLDDKGNILGQVKEVEEFPAQVTLRVKRNGKEDFFVPFIKVFIKSVNIEAKEITINVIEGML